MCMYACEYSLWSMYTCSGFKVEINFQIQALNHCYNLNSSIVTFFF